MQLCSWRSYHLHRLPPRKDLLTWHSMRAVVEKIWGALMSRTQNLQRNWCISRARFLQISLLRKNSTIIRKLNSLGASGLSLIWRKTFGTMSLAENPVSFQWDMTLQDMSKAPTLLAREVSSSSKGVNKHYLAWMIRVISTLMMLIGCTNFRPSLRIKASHSSYPR